MTGIEVVVITSILEKIAQLVCKLLSGQRVEAASTVQRSPLSVSSLANKFIALTGQVDADVDWSVMD